MKKSSFLIISTVLVGLGTIPLIKKSVGRTLYRPIGVIPHYTVNEQDLTKVLAYYTCDGKPFMTLEMDTNTEEVTIVGSLQDKRKTRKLAKKYRLADEELGEMLKQGAFNYFQDYQKSTP
ncbi:hypothetical protein Q73_15270 [Bacillus coahuilensis m2-6]|uniref:hypothetical protein n=1 Tax=Bacillus coahuilensis TaxID=408580 RepID=UPI0007502E6C|nr:hypothetical protein [Bacillus coahuilensis]KUP04489.1 hypothetical protein Q73_15270 [Bacillus coahuilensis m2-6]